MQTLCKEGEAPPRPAVAHPSDVQALAEGAEQAPRRGIWKIALANILQNHKWKQGVPILLTLLQYVEEDMGGEVELAAHHKEFIGEDGGTDDENCLMAMGRYASSSSSQDGANPPEAQEEEEETNGTTGRTGEMESDQEEDTNLDDELRQRLVEGRAWPDPEATAAVAECNSVELEHYMAGLQRQLTSHIRWLRTNRAFWGSLLRSLVHELQVALNGGHPTVHVGAGYAIRPGTSTPESSIFGRPIPSTQPGGGSAAAKAWWMKPPYTVTSWGDYRSPMAGKPWRTKKG